MNNLMRFTFKLLDPTPARRTTCALRLAMIAARRVDVAGMISHRLPLAATGEGFRLMVDGGDCLKILVEPQA